jgi:hypothetical protein
MFFAPAFRFELGMLNDMGIAGIVQMELKSCPLSLKTGIVNGLLYTIGPCK